MTATATRRNPTRVAQEPVYMDVTYWADPVQQIKVKVNELPPGAVNLNVDGRKPLLPLNGFGRLCRKTYSVRLTGSTSTPAEVMGSGGGTSATCGRRATSATSRAAGLVPGEVALLNLTLMGRT